MLGLIGLEIYLKAAVLIETNHRPHGHSFKGLWQKLTPETQQKLLDAAEDRVAGHHQLDRLCEILVALERAFSVGRYSYEINDTRTTEEAINAGTQWVEAGTDPFEADLAYFPTERSGLVCALKDFCQHKLEK